MMLQNHDPKRGPGEIWRDRLLTAAAAVVLGLTLSTVAPADDMSSESKRAAKAEHKATVDKARAEYKVAKQRCESMTGNEKDVCQESAKADYTRAKADAKAAMHSTKADAEMSEGKRDAEFKVAKAKCDSMTGNTRHVCEKEAESKYKH